MRWFANFIRRHPMGLGVVLVLAAAGAFAARAAVLGTGPAGVSNSQVNSLVPDAPRLTASGDERVYRIDASRSSVAYEVTEQLIGKDNTAKGTTKGVAGDLALNTEDASKSRVGEIVVNVEQLTSDQELRDRRIRVEFLESSRHPLARFTTTAVDGLPSSITDGTAYPVTLRGDLTVKTTTKPASLTGTATRSNDEIVLRAESIVSLRDFGVGPISLAGMVQTKDTAKLLFDITAVHESKPVPSGVAKPEQLATSSGGPAPSFGNVVRPILETSCASCHNKGGVGSHVWNLETAADATAVKGGLALVTQSGYMPPWPASEKGLKLKHDRSLSAEQIKAITDWSNAGSPLDVDATTPIKAPAKALGPQVRPDREVTMSEAYQGSTSLTNDYRCFIFDPKITEPTSMTGFDFRPDQVANVHHAVGTLVPLASVPQAKQSDADAPGAGWPCFVGTRGSIAADGGRGGGQFTAWAPGQNPTFFPDGTGLRLDPGDVLVFQIHYHFHHDAPLDRSSVILQLDDRDDLAPVLVDTYLGPAEIPCATWESGPLCDRDAMLDDLASDYGPSVRMIANGLMQVCGAKLEDFAAMTDGKASSFCEMPIAQDANLINMFVHEHELGTKIRLTLNPGTPEERILIDVPHWDFGWQLIYEPAEPFQVKQGDTIRVDCAWDRALSRASESRYITWSEGTEDEMCYTYLTTSPIRP